MYWRIIRASHLDPIRTRDKFHNHYSYFWHDHHWYLFFFETSLSFCHSSLLLLIVYICIKMHNHFTGIFDIKRNHYSSARTIDVAASETNHGTENDEQNDADDDYLTTEEVMRRIEIAIIRSVHDLDAGFLPMLETYSNKSSNTEDGTRTMRKDFGLHQARTLTSIILVLEYCFDLLQRRKTTTVREVYYAHVTHFRNQNECDAAIRDAAVLLQVPRHALGLHASAKGWFCGDLQIVKRNQHCFLPPMEYSAENPHAQNTETETEILLDARQMWQSVHGSIIGSEWLDYSSCRTRNFEVQTQAAHCILVIEKEGIYRRLAQDRFFDKWPCILVTGKGFPDLATRAFVHTLHVTLGLPVWGLSDGNPFGVLILHTYSQGSTKRGLDGGDRYKVPIQWIGLRASQIKALPSTLPPAVFQPLTQLDVQRLSQTLLSERGHGWVETEDEYINDARFEELEDLLEGGTKMELEALHWLGIEYLGEWLGKIFEYNLRENLEDEYEGPELPHLQIL